MSKAICGTLTDYQAQLDAFLEEHPSIVKFLPDKLREFIDKMYNFDMARLAEIFEQLYTGIGRPPRDPLCMLRAYLLSLKLQLSADKLVQGMHLLPVMAVACGFASDDTPGVGTFYDFFKRVCSEKNRLPAIHAPKKAKVAKPAHKGEKAESIEKESCEDLYNYYSENDPLDMLFVEQLVEIYVTGFFQESIDLGLIPDDLVEAGDGTSIYTAARERSKATCDCRANGITNCNCDREYSQPDCDIGWDSDSNCYYTGYNAYGITVAGQPHDLPIFAQLHPASRHDSKALIHTEANMHYFFHLDEMGLKVSSILLDSAHDAGVIYEHYYDQGVKTFIDLNKRRGLSKKRDITLDNYGWPLCPQKLKMRRDGFDKGRRRWKFRCPCMENKGGKLQCTCPNPCSESTYGRVFHISGSDSLRFSANPARGTDEWKAIYKGRTAAERFNKRLKVDYKMESGRHRSSRMWYWRLFGIMMCLHFDAWDLSGSSPFAKSKSL